MFAACILHTYERRQVGLTEPYSEVTYLKVEVTARGHECNSHLAAALFVNPLICFESLSRILAVGFQFLSISAELNVLLIS